MDRIENLINNAGAIAEFAMVFFSQFMATGFNNEQSFMLTRDLLIHHIAFDIGEK